MALTFDDGPYLYTGKVLDLLKEYNASATFFITGNNLGKGRIDDPLTVWPDLIRRMRDEGHQIGSHGWSHANLSAVSPERREKEIIYNEMALRNIVGFFPKYFRPPYGSCTIASGCIDALTKKGYHVVNWDVDTKDIFYNFPDLIQYPKNKVKEVITKYYPQIAGNVGSPMSHLVLAHDSAYYTAYDLAEFMLRHVTAMGYDLVTVGECLGDEGDWYTDSRYEEGASECFSPSPEVEELVT